VEELDGEPELSAELAQLATVAATDLVGVSLEFAAVREVSLCRDETIQYIYNTSQIFQVLKDEFGSSCRIICLRGHQPLIKILVVGNLPLVLLAMFSRAAR
jgi:hypothetical protein